MAAFLQLCDGSPEQASSHDDASLVSWEQEILDAAVYHALPQSSAVVDATRHLREAIILCLLPAESKLPSERELADRIGVGVVTMRSALAMLRSEGFITTARGRGGGSWVASCDEILEASARTTTFSMDELGRKVDLLVAVETQAMGLAAERANDAERAKILQLGDYPRDRLTTRDWQMYANVFHLRIAHASHNVELAAAVRSARARLQELRNAVYGRVIFCVRASEFHPRVARAIADGDSEQARALCHSWLTSTWYCNTTVIQYAEVAHHRIVPDERQGLFASWRVLPQP